MPCRFELPSTAPPRPDKLMGPVALIKMPPFNSMPLNAAAVGTACRFAAKVRLPSTVVIRPPDESKIFRGVVMLTAPKPLVLRLDVAFGSRTVFPATTVKSLSVAIVNAF